MIASFQKKANKVLDAAKAAFQTMEAAGDPDPVQAGHDVDADEFAKRTA